jgi:ubiquitin-protein ligase
VTWYLIFKTSINNLFVYLDFVFKLKGIKAVPVSEDKMKWKAEIKGLQNSIWHGLCFQTYLFLKSFIPFIACPPFT